MERLLALVEASPGINIRDAADTLGSPLRYVHRDASELRAFCLLMPAAYRVPLVGGNLGLKVRNHPGDTMIDMYGFFCAFGGSVRDYAEDAELGTSAAYWAARRLEARGLLAPAGSLWTGDQYVAQQKAATKYLHRYLTTRDQRFMVAA